MLLRSLLTANSLFFLFLPFTSFTFSPPPFLLSIEKGLKTEGTLHCQAPGGVFRPSSEEAASISVLPPGGGGAVSLLPSAACPPPFSLKS